MRLEITKKFIQMNPKNTLLAYLKEKSPRRTEIFVGFATCVINGVGYSYSKKLRQWVARVVSGQKVKPITCFIRENVG